MSRGHTDNIIGPAEGKAKEQTGRIGQGSPGVPSSESCGHNDLMAEGPNESAGFIPDLDEIIKPRRTSSPENILNENQVIDIIREHLISLGFTKCSVNYTGSTGIDLEACNPTTGEEYAVECKGETSSKSDSRKYGQGFNSGKVEHSVGRAVYTTLKQWSPDRDGKYRVAMGFPDSPLYRKHVEAIKTALDRIGIVVFFASKNGEVNTMAPPA
jgi:hypothetical protein